MRVFRTILIIIILFGTHLAYAEVLNVGFVQGLWYSPEPVFTSVPTRIYVALRNNTPHDLTGTVRFTDNGKRIGSSEVRALSGRIVETWVDWTPTKGEHTIVASVSDARLHIIGGGTESVIIDGLLAEDSLTIDTDTDDDGIGNETDTDDDGDTISDVDEKARGTNPLVKNEVPLSSSDKNEILTTTPAPARIISSEETIEERGLEKYLSAGSADLFLGNVTQKVDDAKQTLDAYRESRNAALTPEEGVSEKETTLGTYTENATITRSKIETKNTFLSSFISGVAALFQNIWTFILWVTSKILTQPALIELALLIGILFAFYRTARRFGRRPKY